MDIVDIILARAKSFTGETATLIQQAQAAMADANSIVNQLEEIETRASNAATTAENAAETLAGINDTIDTEIKKLSLSVVSHGMTNGGGVTYDLVTTYPDNTTSTVNDIIRMYNDRGSHVNGTMTQEAIHHALALIEQDLNNFTVNVTDDNTSAVKTRKINVSKNGQTTSYPVEKNYTSAGENEDGSMTQKAIKSYVKTEIENKLSNITINNGGTVNYNNFTFTVDDAGHIIIIGPDGTPIAGSTTESDIIAALIKAGVYNVNDAVGLQIDYSNKTFSRMQDASGKVAGADFNIYSMYGGRMRCNVLDDGTITAFYGDNNYTEDGSNGQVMVYQPKFYYQRTPITMTKLQEGYSIRKEALIISSAAKPGFKLHPLFINEDGEQIDYVLLPAYQGSVYDTSESNYNLNSNLTIDFANDKLSSIANAKPISGSDINNFTVATAERLARNRGQGWHITNMAAESANQMLFIIEYGQLNGQTAIEQGIVTIPTISGKNCASLTGSTSELGNTTGTATLTRNESNGTYTSYNSAGKRAISYRGVENPWGNLWHFIGGINVSGNGHNDGGYPYICTDFNYALNEIANNYVSIGFKLPAIHSWISAMGYGNTDYDWVYIPSECSSANSLLPVGDNLWTDPTINGINCVVCGGSYSSEDSAGLFYYGCDTVVERSAVTFGANLMFIPTKNNIYTANCEKWLAKFGGD